MANRGLVYGYDDTNNRNQRLIAFSDGSLGVSITSGSAAGGGDASSAKQSEMITILNGISADVALTVPGVSGPTQLLDGSALVPTSTTITGTVSMGNYNHLTIFGRTVNQSTWKLVYYDGSGNTFEELDGTTAQTSDGTGGTSYVFSQTWNYVGAKTVGLLNAGIPDDNPLFYYSLTR